MGMGLAAAAGIRATVPLLMLVIWAKFQYITINPKLAFLLNEQFISYLAIACMIEILGDKLSFLESKIDPFLLLLRPVIGLGLVYAVIDLHNPIYNFFAAFMLGSLTTLPLHSFRSGTRMFSGAVSHSFFNPVLSLTEDLIAIGGSLLALAVPYVGLLVTVLVTLIVVRFFRQWKLDILKSDDNVM